MSGCSLCRYVGDVEPLPRVLQMPNLPHGVHPVAPRRRRRRRQQMHTGVEFQREVVRGRERVGREGKGTPGPLRRRSEGLAASTGPADASIAVASRTPATSIENFRLTLLTVAVHYISSINVSQREDQTIVFVIDIGQVIDRRHLRSNSTLWYPAQTTQGGITAPISHTGTLTRWHPETRRTQNATIIYSKA